jgi:DNA-binding transcriptional LysR family regulator
LAVRTLTIAQLAVLDALVTEGSLQAAAEHLGRSHPTLHTTLHNMERELGFKLFDRSGYRLELTREGSAFLARARRVLGEMEELHAFADHVARGAEAELKVVIGDLSPLAKMLALLKSFFKAHRQTRLELDFGSLSGPWEMLMEDRADLILHHVEEADPRFETVQLGRVKLVPVAAPGYLPFPAAAATVARMRDLVQCVIRDSASRPAARSYFIIEGARTCTVSDQIMKKEVILQGLGWGHLPDYLIEDELRDGTLISFANRHFRGSKVNLVAARKLGKLHGPVASQLWKTLAARERL